MDFTEKSKNSIFGKKDRGKIAVGNVMLDDLGGGGDRLSPGKTLCAEFITELTHKRTKEIILRWHFFPQNDIFFFHLGSTVQKHTAKSFGLVARQPPLLGHCKFSTFFTFLILLKMLI